jgi:hypothetical protein
MHPSYPGWIDRISVAPMMDWTDEVEFLVGSRVA